MSKRFERARAGRSRRWFTAAAAGALVATMSPMSQAGAGSFGATERVSVATGGGQSTLGGGIPAPSISLDGRYVAWHTRAEGLVPGDTNDAEDAFVHDRVTGITSRVSLTAGGGQANARSLFPSISGDGRYVVFGSGATNLVAGDTNATPSSPTANPADTGRDTFVYDRVSGAVTRENVSSAEEEGKCFNAQNVQQACGGGVALAEADLNFDGRYVAFAGNATNLVPGDTNGQTDIFVRDRVAGTTTRVSVSSVPTATQATGGSSLEPSISADGRFVAFSSAATAGLVPPHVGTARQIYVHDRENGFTTRISTTSGPAGVVGNGNSSLPAISSDGQFVVFASLASNLVPGDTNNEQDIFVHDRVAQTTTRVSVATGGGQAPLGSFFPHISGNGRFVAFDSIANNLVAGDTNGLSDVFVHDRSNGTTSRASLTRNATEAFGGGSFFPALSFDGRYVAFSSEAANLVPGDTNAAPDVFVHDRTLPKPFSDGYRMVASDGGVFAFGDAPFFGSTGGTRLNEPMVGMASTPRNRGYWLVARDGGIFAFGDARFHGSTGATRLARPIVGMASTPSGGGYYLVAADGGIFAFGDAVFRGSTGALRLTQPIVGMAVTPSGNGYWLVAADGGVFAFGDAVFRGSTGALRLAQPIVGIGSTPSGNGYYLVAADGGIFAFGDAVFRGSTGALRLAQPIVAMAVNPSGGGYWLIARDGGIFAFGDAAFRGSTGAIRLNQPVVGGGAG